MAEKSHILPCSPLLYHGKERKSNLCSQKNEKSIDKECAFGYYKSTKRRNVREKWGEVMERRTQRRVVRKSRKIRKNTFVLLTMALILCLGTLAMGAQKGMQTKTYYESVEVERGDTLWKIAAEYAAEDEEIEHMVDEILELNNMKNTNIRSGESIIVPVTKAV